MEEKKTPQENKSFPISNEYPDELIDHYWGSINYFFELIKASEIKAGLILSFYGIATNILYKKVEEVFTDFPNNMVLYSLIGLWFLSTVISIYYSFRCFMPRKETKFAKNILYFGDVITKFGDVNEFSKTFLKVSNDKDQLFDQLGQHIFIISKIASTKFKNVNTSLRFLAISIVLLLAGFIYRLLLAF